MPEQQFDLIVVGLGPGGEEVAERMAAAGWSVLGVESNLVGGECPYYGCIPSKMIIRGAEVLAEARRIPQLSGEADVTPDYGKVASRIRNEATDNWDDAVAVQRFERLGGTFARGRGYLDGRGENGSIRVRVGDVAYTAPHVVIAVGTAPAMAPIDGLAGLQRSVDGPVWTNREVMQAPAAPGSIVVLGGGTIGVEIGQGLARFGTRVTMVEAADRILGVEEPEVCDVVAEALRRDGVDLRVGTRATAVAAGGDGVVVTLADGTTVTGEKALVALGRRSNLADVGLDALGLDARARTLDVDDGMRVMHDGVAVEGLYGIGDSTGRGAFTHVAVWQARVLIAKLLERDEPFGGYHGIAWATFTDPEVGRVGLTEAQARERGITVRTGQTNIASSTRGWIHGPGNDGLVKLVEDADRGVLVGATVVSPYGGEIVGLLTLAVHANVPTATLASMHYVYPTLHRTVLDAVRDLRS